MDNELFDQVWQANSSCEYCHLSQRHSHLTFEVDHIIAISHRKPTRASNLALACFYCNRYKGPNIAGIDPVSRKLSPLFHPRRNKWSRHFRYDGPILVGLTRVGRATIDVLKINEPEAVALREALMAVGTWQDPKP